MKHMLQTVASLGVLVPLVEAWITHGSIVCENRPLHVVGDASLELKRAQGGPY